MEGDDSRSVRIEFEHTHAAPIAPEVGGPNPGPSNRGALAVGVIAVVLAVTLIAVLRPSGDETADGNARGPTTTTAPATTSQPSTTEAVTTTRVTVQKFTQMIPASGLREFEEIARSGGRFVALQFEEAENGPPRILQATDGMAWTPARTSLDAPSDVTGAVLLRDYESLIATRSGFALLMTTIRLRSGESAPRYETVRLESTDGIEWTLDPGFDAIVSDNFVRPIHHSARAFATFRLREEAVDPESGDGPGECDATRRDGSSGQGEITVVRDGIAPVAPSLVPANVTMPIVLDDGGLVVIDLNDRRGSNASCTGFLDPTFVRTSALLRWSPEGGDPELFSLPADFVVGLTEDSEARPMAFGSQIFVVVDSTAWNVDVATGNWNEILRVPELPGDTASAQILEDVAGLAVVTPEVLGLNTGAGLEWTWVGTDPELVAPTIQYADIETLIISDDQGAFVVGLPLDGD